MMDTKVKHSFNLL